MKEIFPNVIFSVRLPDDDYYSNTWLIRNIEKGLYELKCIRKIDSKTGDLITIHLEMSYIYPEKEA